MKRINAHQHLWELEQLPNSWWAWVVWGGDWPVCTLTSTLRQWVEASDTLFVAAAQADREKVFYKNTEKIYRI